MTCPKCKTGLVAKKVALILKCPKCEHSDFWFNFFKKEARVRYAENQGRWVHYNPERLHQDGDQGILSSSRLDES